MATSQNGWPVITDRSKINNTPINGHAYPNGFLAGDVYKAFTWLFTQLSVRVESVTRGNPADEWGWYVKKIEGGNSISNHASATAGDYNASEHAMGKRGTYSPSQVATIHTILEEANGIFRWGGDYTGRPDEMHFEIVASQERVHEFVNSLGGKVHTYTELKGYGLPILTAGMDDDNYDNQYRAVSHAQVLLNYHNHDLTVDGVYGPRMVAAVKSEFGSDGKHIDISMWAFLAGLSRNV